MTLPSASSCTAIRERLQDSDGQPGGTESLRFLEKTPKNALRIPFLQRLFPGRPVHVPVARSAREHQQHHRGLALRPLDYLSRSCQAGTGPGRCCCRPSGSCNGGARSRKSPPGNGTAPIATSADDLAALPREHWTVVRYDELRDSAPATLQRLCDFLGLEVDDALPSAWRTAAPSRYTLDAPGARQVAQQRRAD